MTGTIIILKRTREWERFSARTAKSYTFRRNDVREVWFHDLTEGTTVDFGAREEPFRDQSAPWSVRPLDSRPTS